jgi:hypothetical protein
MQQQDTESNLGKSKLRLNLYSHQNYISEVWHSFSHTKFGVKQFYIPFPVAPFHRSTLLSLSLFTTLTNDNDNQQNGEPSSLLRWHHAAFEPRSLVDYWIYHEGRGRRNNGVNDGESLSMNHFTPFIILPRSKRMI